MTEKRRPFQHLVFVLGFLLTTYQLVAGRADFRPDATIVGDIINTDTTWTKAGSPYEATSIITMISNVTLTMIVFPMDWAVLYTRSSENECMFPISPFL